MAKNLLLWVVIAVVLMAVFNNFGPPTQQTNSIGYSEFIAQVKSGQVENVVIQNHTVKGKLASGESFTTYAPDDPKLIDDLLAAVPAGILGWGVLWVAGLIETATI